MVHQTHQAVTDIIKSKKFTVSAEIIPPRNGQNVTSIFQQMETLQKANTDFVSVTKGAGGSLRGGTLPIAQLAQGQYGMCAIAHFTCRDFTIEEVENSLMDHHYFGIQNILALRGDPPDGSVQAQSFVPTGNRHQYAYQLIEQIEALNKGQYLVREGFDQSVTNTRPGEATRFCIGAAAYPEENTGVDYFQKKIRAGAQYGITQMIYDEVAYGRFLEGLRKSQCDVPILPGVRILTNAGTALRMKEKFGVNVPMAMVEKLQKYSTNKEESKKIGLEMAIQLCEKLRSLGAPGIHVFIMNDANLGSDLIQALRSKDIT